MSLLKSCVATGQWWVVVRAQHRQTVSIEPNHRDSLSGILLGVDYLLYVVIYWINKFSRMVQCSSGCCLGGGIGSYEST